ncbi:MAG: aldose 1-epimerase family protein [Clostridia bacterium]|nr:aldose 1-epimerase family protein [Clostridia bacterium]
MLYEIKNQYLTVTINDLGAELWSIRRNDGKLEYMWQGDAAYWEDRSPLMFPFCGRVQGEIYSYEGKSYPMGCHGFAAGEIFSVERLGEDAIAMTLRASEKTRTVYPFDFTFTVTYRLTENRLSMMLEVKNTDQKPLPFMVGAHPGFFVPLDSGDFEDWFLEFGETAVPRQMEISPNGFRTGKTELYALENGRVLRLSHRLFDIDGIFLEGAARSVTLRSERSDRFVTLSYPDCPYIGFWHCSGEAPYLCIEPWSGMPAVEGESEDLSEKTDLLWLDAGKGRKVAIELIFG